LSASTKNTPRPNEHKNHMNKRIDKYFKFILQYF
jgi:hypothetical protein